MITLYIETESDRDYIDTREAIRESLAGSPGLEEEEIVVSDAHQAENLLTLIFDAKSNVANKTYAGVRRKYRPQVNFARWMTEKINEQGITQVELSARTGIATTSLSRYKNGVRVPDINVATKIADALGERSMDAFKYDPEGFHEKVC